MFTSDGCNDEPKRFYTLFPPPALASTHTCTLSIKLITKNTTHFSYTLAADWPRCRSYTNTRAPTRRHTESETDRQTVIHMPDVISLNKWPTEKFIMCVRFAQKKTVVECTKKRIEVTVTVINRKGKHWRRDCESTPSCGVCYRTNCYWRRKCRKRQQKGKELEWMVAYITEGNWF